MCVCVCVCVCGCCMYVSMHTCTILCTVYRDLIVVLKDCDFFKFGDIIKDCG